MTENIEVRFEKRSGISTAWVKCVVDKVLRYERSRIRLSILITTDREIQKINKRFLNHDRPTDVISFETGDLVVSADTARRVAKEIGIPYHEELARYLVHGTLHLLGYDDGNKKDSERMHKRQEMIVTRLNGRRPKGTASGG